MTVDLRGRLPTHPTKRYDYRSMDDIAYLVLHHSGVDVDSSAEKIASYHVNTLGWPGCGYAAVARWSGLIELTQYLAVVAYHVAGKNRIAAGLCIVGDYTHHLPPMPAMEAAVEQFLAWRAMLRRPVPVVAHRDLAIPGWETACPGDALYAALHEGYGPFARLKV